MEKQFVLIVLMCSEKQQLKESRHWCIGNRRPSASKIRRDDNNHWRSHGGHGDRPLPLFWLGIRECAKNSRDEPFSFWHLFIRKYAGLCSPRRCFRCFCYLTYRCPLAAFRQHEVPPPTVAKIILNRSFPSWILSRFPVCQLRRSIINCHRWLDFKGRQMACKPYEVRVRPTRETAALA